MSDGREVFRRKENGWVVTVSLIVFLILALCFSVRPEGKAAVDSGYRPVMKTFGRVIAVAADSRTAKRCIKIAFAEIHKADELMIVYSSHSNLGKANGSTFKQVVKVSEQIHAVLQKALELAQVSAVASDSTFTKSVNPSPWAVEVNPSPADAEVRSKVDCGTLMLDSNDMSARSGVDGVKVDWSRMVRGYAIDRAVETMQSCGATGGMVCVGGIVRCFGTPPPGESAGANKSCSALKLTNAALVICRADRLFTSIETKMCNRMNRAGSGFSPDGQIGVAIISKDATTACALVTAVSVVGVENGLALIETMPESEAILIPSDPECELVGTSGVEKYILAGS